MDGVDAWAGAQLEVTLWICCTSTSSFGTSRVIVSPIVPPVPSASAEATKVTEGRKESSMPISKSPVVAVKGNGSRIESLLPSLELLGHEEE